MKPRKAIVIAILIVFGTALLLFLAAPMWGSWLIQRSMHKTYDAISKIVLPCEENNSQVIERWGKDGYSISCQNNGVKDGPWQAWEGGRVSITGYYTKGKESDTWLVYMPNGKLYRTVTYQDGRELTNVIHE